MTAIPLARSRAGQAAPAARAWRVAPTVSASGLLLSLLFLTSTVGFATPWQGTDTVVDGVRQVHSPATPSDGQRTLEPVELWRIGGDSDNEGEFFGIISDIAVAPTGEVYLLDRQLTEVRVFSSDGEYLRTIGREGEGPGEFRNASDLVLFSDGNVGVVQMMPARIEMLTPQGDPAGTFPLPSSDDGGMRQLMGAELSDDSLLLMGASMKFDAGGVERTRRLVRVDLEGHEQAEFVRSQSKIDMANLLLREKELFGDQWVVGPDGRPSLAAWDYQIRVYDLNGTLAEVISRDFDPYVRSEDEVAEVRHRMSTRIQIRGPNREPQFEVADTEPAVRWMQRTDDNSLWVLNAREYKDQKPGTIGTFDVFDPEGHFVQQVTLNGECNLEEDRLVMTHDRLFIITQFWSAVAAAAGGGEGEGGEADEDLMPMEVICCRLDTGTPTGR